MGLRIWVTVKANAKKVEVQRTDSGAYLARVKAQARAGKANRDLVGALAGYFSVPASAVRILHGHRSRTKLIEIDAAPRSDRGARLGGPNSSRSR